VGAVKTLDDLIDAQRFADLAGGRSHGDGLYRNGRIAYCRTHRMIDHADAIRKLGPVVLVSSGSDAKVTPELASRLPANVVRWFATNNVSRSPRVQGIPIGWPANDRQDAARRAAGTGVRRRGTLYVCHTETQQAGYDARRGLLDHYRGCAWATVEGGASCDSVGPEQYYRGLLGHRFVLSPPGYGPDCHRHWEAIALGCVPIVVDGPWRDAFRRLPMLTVPSLFEVDEDTMDAAGDLEIWARVRHPLETFTHWQKGIHDTANQL